MAYSATKLKDDCFGSMRIQVYTMTADANSGGIDTGLNNVVFSCLQAASCTTSNMLIKNNIGSAATAIGGSVFFSGFTNADGFCLVVYGN